jgi:SAM-dependent methyltransferase
MNPAELANIAALEDSFWWYSGMRTILFELLDPVFTACRPKRVLEVGCGTGYMAQQFEKRYGTRLYATDLAWQALQYSKERGFDALTQSNLMALPYASEAFDAAVSLDVLVHLTPGPDRTGVAELARVLKPNAILVVRVAALDALRSRHSQFIYEAQRFTRKRLCALLTENGFEIIRCTYANSILTPVAFAKFRLWEPLTRQRPTSGVAPIGPRMNTLLERALKTEARWLARGHNLPLGQSLIAIARKT